MRLVTLLPMFTRIQLIILGMIFLLFPAMTMNAMILIWTPFPIIVDIGSWTPIIALIFRVVIKLRLPSEILPVMRVDTLIPEVVSFVVRTPYGFEMKHVKIRILFKFIYQLYWNFGFWMSERAIFTIFTFTSAINIGWTKLCFIFIWMIKFFYPIVRLLTSISVGAFLAFQNTLAHLRLVWP